LKGKSFDRGKFLRKIMERDMKYLSLLLLLLSLCLGGCSYGGYGIYDDQRLMDTMSSDKALATKIKTALMGEKFFDGWSIAVYSYYKHVFLVGEIPPEMEEKALTIAHRYHPSSVTAHWFTAEKSEVGNLTLRTRLRSSLIGAKNLSSSRIDTEVNSGRVVLLGVVQDEEERQLAIRTAESVQGVTAVTSYLMLPLRGTQSIPEYSEAVTHEGVEGHDLP
jgi:hyperosmotically inducible protein